VNSNTCQQINNNDSYSTKFKLSKYSAHRDKFHIVLVNSMGSLVDCAVW